MNSKNREEVLHILRNPHGHSDKKVRWARLEAAEEIENLLDAYANMRAYAEQNGLDTTARRLQP